MNKGIVLSAYLSVLLVLTACAPPIVDVFGSLQINITGLPAGTDADVTVTGPGGFTEDLTATETLDFLDVGSYTVTAQAVNALNPTVTGSPANVTDGGTATVTVAYAAAGTTGSLQVNITGLPAGTDADVTVTGPGGFTQNLTATETLSNLDVGSYTVAAQAVNTLNPTITGSPADVTAGGTATATVAYGGAPAGNFNIVLRFTNAGAIRLSQADQQLFEQAATRWEQIITGDLPDVTFTGGNSIPAGTCDNAPEFVGTVDDLLIDVLIAPDDGPGGSLASAGPTFGRMDANQLPAHGCMTFDSADLGAGLLDTIIHEMGHVLGIGTYWQDSNPNDFVSDGGVPGCDGNSPTDPVYSGPLAVQQWQLLGGAGNVPVANTGGPGSACGHWREGVFDTESMTPFSDDGVPNPISAMTIASLEDIGYTVDYGQAEAFTLPGCNPNCIVTADATPIVETLLRPIGVVDSEGNISYFK